MRSLPKFYPDKLTQSPLKFEWTGGETVPLGAMPSDPMSAARDSSYGLRFARWTPKRQPQYPLDQEEDATAAIRAEETDRAASEKTEAESRAWARVCRAELRSTHHEKSPSAAAAAVWESGGSGGRRSTRGGVGDSSGEGRSRKERRSDTGTWQGCALLGVALCLAKVYIETQSVKMASFRRCLVLQCLFVWLV
jgi:hypothetical protein